jgi:uncharacterized protein HemY
MAPVSKTSLRLQARVRQDFPSGAAEQVLVFLQSISDVQVASRQDLERLQMAAFILLEGDLLRVTRVQKILAQDWRDALVWAGLGHPDWPDRLNEMLGSP